MSWQKRSIQLILGLPLAMPIVSYAIEVGDTYVESGQNQPLNASINVTDIDPATFSVKVGNAAMYQQLGLSPDQPIDVKFQPTSSNGGKIILTSTQPVATPYTDVVLDIQNKGEKKVLPKTLLMPLGSNPAPSAVTQAPAPLVEAPEPAKVTVNSNPNIELPTTTTPVETAVEPTTQTTSSEPPVTATTLPNGTITYKSDSLIIQETKGTDTGTIATSTAPSEPSEVKVEAKPETTTSETAESTETSEETKAESSNETVTYTIQRNETLWTIANRVAKGSKKDVHTVMQEIIDQNPDAFENGDPTKIVANTKLQVPKYKTAPSQAAIKNTKQIRKQVGKAKKPVYTKTNAKPVSAPRVTKPVTTTKSSKKVVKTRKAYPVVKQKYTAPVSRPKTRKTEMVIVAPQQSNGSAQGTTTTTTTTTKVVNSQVATQLEQKRQATAAQAAKVNALNNSISSSEQKIKIQNQKLAQLEQRLKELNKK